MTRERDGFELQVRRSESDQALDIEIDLDAAPEQVWTALTDAEELMSWFPFQAKVEPGTGGKIFMSWDGAWEGELAIEAWEPGRHLRTTWPWTAEDGRAGEPSPAVVDYYLSARRGGGTRLRLVHSGFPVGDEWQEIFDGTRRGWSYELRSLRHYLRHHRGRRRRVTRVRRPLAAGSADRVWTRLWSRDGLLAAGSIDAFEPGRAYDFTMPGGIRLAGRILVALPPTDLGATVETAGQALLRLSVEHWSGPEAPPELHLWLVTWGQADEGAAAIVAAWEEALDRVLAS